MKKIMEFTLSGMLFLSFASCLNPAPVERKYVTTVRGDDTTVEYRAYLLTTGAKANDDFLATANDAIQITVFEKNQETILKTYKGFKHAAMQLKPRVKLVVLLHDGKKKVTDTILLR